MQELISIIVPVYNVEPYIEQCLNSIRGQTYSNIEVFLVDDGSTDNSFNIVKEYVKEDKRLTLIEQAHQGLSAARNNGIEHSSGRYLSFIDSDDYIRDDFIEVLYSTLVENDADMVLCNDVRVDEGGNVIPNRSRVQLKKAAKAGRDVMDTYIANRFNYLFIVAWNKLYKRELFNTIRYPLGRYHEDQFIIFRLMDLCERVAFTGEALYCYRRRNDSITVAGNVNKRTEDVLQAYEEKADYFKEHKEFLYMMKILVDIVYIHQERGRALSKDRRKSIQKEFRTCTKKIKWTSLSAAEKIKYVLCSISICAYVRLNRILVIKKK